MRYYFSSLDGPLESEILYFGGSSQIASGGSELSTEDSSVSFATLYEEYAPGVYRFALCLTRDSAVAEELTSETFFRAWVRRDTILQSTMRSYLFTVAKNVYRDRLRRSKNQVALAQDYVDTGATPGEAMERSEQYATLHGLLDSLPEPDKQILTLRYQEEMSYEEIASIVGMNAASARIRAHRARRKLLQAYAEKATNRERQ